MNQLLLTEDLHHNQFWPEQQYTAAVLRSAVCTFLHLLRRVMRKNRLQPPFRRSSQGRDASGASKPSPISTPVFPVSLDAPSAVLTLANAASACGRWYFQPACRSARRFFATICRDIHPISVPVSAFSAALIAISNFHRAFVVGLEMIHLSYQSCAPEEGSSQCRSTVPQEHRTADCRILHLWLSRSVIPARPHAFQEKGYVCPTSSS